MSPKDYYVAGRGNEFDLISGMWIDHKKIWGGKRE